ncbi:sodium bile acid symporter family protein [Dictyocaulus viviparus]|uniref:Sodium bile acid symporter family protein n=1 Tax=Dictyocaulus viviparus TaxID=29172 RepID=A0A0D8XY58_DICVI|nr:sodium bile acid symporter family protein [Dictyocaulus viviparus]
MIYRKLIVHVIDVDSNIIDGYRNRTVSARCIDKDVCKVISYPEMITLQSDDDNTSTSFEIVIKALFLGVTDLNVIVGDEQLPSFAIRVLRSSHEVKVKQLFTLFLMIFVFIISLMMGTQLEVKRIMDIVRKPIGPTIGLLCQFGMMPIIGFLLAEFGLPEDAISLKMALFAVSTCPGGGKSSFWTIIFGGNLDLSISMTFTQTIAALLMMPLWMSTLGKHFTNVHVRIPFIRIVEGLFGLMIPSIMGMMLTYYRPQYIAYIRVWIKRISWAATIIISILAIYTYHYIFWLLTWPIIICGCSLPWLGYITAFVVALILNQSFKDSLTIAIETGIQNIGIATLLMMWCLPEPESDIAITIIFVTAIMTDKPLVIIYLISRAYTKCCKNNTVQQEDDKSKKIGEISTVTMSTIASGDSKEGNSEEVEKQKSW